jgi:hypothetical protein
MTQRTTSFSGLETISSIWESDKRLRMASLGGILGGAVLTFLSVSRTGLAFELGSINIVYPLGYILLAVSLLAGNARYTSSYGGAGNIIALLFVLSLVTYAASVAVIVLSMHVFGFQVSQFTSLVGVAFFAIRIFGTMYGVILWRQTNSSRLAAGLFAVILPSMFILGPLVLLGVPAFGIELPLYVAFIIFGYELWTATPRNEYNTGSR